MRSLLAVVLGVGCGNTGSGPPDGGSGSDGLEEQWNPANQEFGMARVEAALGDRGRDLPAAVQRLVDEWTAFLGGSRPDDDATLIAAECLE